MVLTAPRLLLIRPCGCPPLITHCTIEGLYAGTRCGQSRNPVKWRRWASNSLMCATPRLLLQRPRPRPVPQVGLTPERERRRGHLTPTLRLQAAPSYFVWWPCSLPRLVPHIAIVWQGGRSRGATEGGVAGVFDQHPLCAPFVMHITTDALALAAPYILLRGPTRMSAFETNLTIEGLCRWREEPQEKESCQQETEHGTQVDPATTQLIRWRCPPRVILMIICALARTHERILLHLLVSATPLSNIPPILIALRMPVVHGSSEVP